MQKPWVTCVGGERARNYILRLFWHLSDESGAYCIGAPLGIAEIGRNNPEEFEGFKNKYVSLTTGRWRGSM